MDVRMEPRKLSGIVTPPPSKSMSHRLIIAASLAVGTSTIRNVAFSQDIEATLRCMEALGARWKRERDTLTIEGIGGAQQTFEALPRFDCGESGSTLRFLIPIALAVSGGGVFIGRGRLMERPQEPYFDLFDQIGVSYTLKDGVLTIRGRLSPGEYRLPGNVSSQFFTGLLFALPLLEKPSRVVSTTELESAAYVTMTMGALERAHVPVNFSIEKNCFHLVPSFYGPLDMAVEADWSQGAFWYAALSLGGQVRIRGLDAGSYQGDKVVATHAGTLSMPGDVTIDLSGCPDLLPPLAVMAAVRRGTTIFKGAARLRMKESDRLATVAAMLKSLGGSVIELPDSLVVHGLPDLFGGRVDGANDHRVVMAAAIAATVCAQPVIITGAEAVKKSYPNFWEHYEQLGGEVYVL